MTNAPPIDKKLLIEALCAELQAQVTASTARAKATAASATHAESKAEDDKDTRAIEESYLARGQAQRAAELELDRKTLRFLPLRSYEDDAPIALSALVTLEAEDGERKLIFLAPCAGGLTVDLDGARVQLVTPASPLGGALIGREEGDEVTAGVARKRRRWEIVRVR